MVNDVTVKNTFIEVGSSEPVPVPAVSLEKRKTAPPADIYAALQRLPAEYHDQVQPGQYVPATASSPPKPSPPSRRVSISEPTAEAKGGGLTLAGIVGRDPNAAASCSSPKLVLNGVTPRMAQFNGGSVGSTPLAQTPAAARRRLSWVEAVPATPEAFWTRSRSNSIFMPAATPTSPVATPVSGQYTRGPYPQFATSTSLLQPPQPMPIQGILANSSAPVRLLGAASAAPPPQSAPDSPALPQATSFEIASGHCSLPPQQQRIGQACGVEPNGFEIASGHSRLAQMNNMNHLPMHPVVEPQTQQQPAQPLLMQQQMQAQGLIPQPQAPMQQQQPQPMLQRQPSLQEQQQQLMQRVPSHGAPQPNPHSQAPLLPPNLSAQQMMSPDPQRAPYHHQQQQHHHFQATLPAVMEPTSSQGVQSMSLDPGRARSSTYSSGGEPHAHGWQAAPQNEPPPDLRGRAVSDPQTADSGPLNMPPGSGGPGLYYAGPGNVAWVQMPMMHGGSQLLPASNGHAQVPGMQPGAPAMQLSSLGPDNKPRLDLSALVANGMQPAPQQLGGMVAQPQQLAGVVPPGHAGPHAPNPAAPLGAVPGNAVPVAPMAQHHPQALDAEDGNTTVMLRNIPVKYNREMMLVDMDQRGFRGSYDFFYLPIDFHTGNTMGYAFINFVNRSETERFRMTYSGLKLSPDSPKICEVVHAKAQGKAKNVEQYRNSSVMSMDERFHPVVFENGMRQPFPGPTRVLKPVKPKAKG